MKAIGGFFEIERELSVPAECHPAAYALSSGRGAFRAILERVQPRRVLVPFYTCDALLEPLRLLQIPFSFYELDASLKPREEFALAPGEHAVVINYFGLKSDEVLSLAQRWGRQLIVDNTQAFFDGPAAGAYSFNSARKFFGVPDGSFLYSPEPLSLCLPENTDISLDHLLKRSAGDLPGAYLAFRAAEALVNSDVKGMSLHSRTTIHRIPHSWVQDRRRTNFFQYERAFAESNAFSIPLSPRAVPFCYPLLPSRQIDRRLLHEQGIFVPTFWPELAQRTEPGFGLERRLAKDLLPLPVDHRYDADDLNRVIKIVGSLLKTNRLPDLAGSQAGVR
jgi:hypothetical protein